MQLPSQVAHVCCGGGPGLHPLPVGWVNGWGQVLQSTGQTAAAAAKFIYSSVMCSWHLCLSQICRAALAQHAAVFRKRNNTVAAAAAALTLNSCSRLLICRMRLRVGLNTHHGTGGTAQGVSHCRETSAASMLSGRSWCMHACMHVHHLLLPGGKSTIGLLHCHATCHTIVGECLKLLPP